MARRPSSAIHSSSSWSLALTLPPLRELLLREQAGLDPLGELDLHLGVQQRDLADLLEVVLDRVGGRAGDHDLLRRLIGLVGVGDDEGRGGLLLVLLDGGVGDDVLLELLVGQVGEDLLAVGTDHGRGVGRGRRGLLGRGRLLGRRRLLRRGLLRRPAPRRPWPRPSSPAPSWRGSLLGGRRGGRLASRRGGDRAGADRDAHRDAEAAQVRQQRLEVAGLDRGVLTGLPDLVGGDAAGRSTRLDQGQHRGVCQHLGGKLLARVRGHEHLSSGAQGAAEPGIVNSRNAHCATRPKPHRTRGCGQPVGADRALAAAFICFLWSRTFCSDAGSTTSATER